MRMCLTLLLAALTAHVYAQPLPAEPDFAFVLAAMKAERLKVRSGVCRITGTMRSTSNNVLQPAIEGPVEYLVVFDGDKIRFDRTSPGWVTNRHPKQSSLAKMLGRKPSPIRRGTQKHHFCDDGTKAAYWNEDADGLSIWASSAESQRKIGSVGYFDVRTLGLHSPVGLRRQLRLQELFELQAKRLEKPMVLRPRTDQWVLQADMKDEFEEVQEKFVIDVANGYTPIEYSMGQRNHRRDEAWSTSQWMAIRWEKRKEVWVPIHVSTRITPARTSSREESQFTLDWEKINEPIDPALFRYESFGVPDWVWILDGTLPDDQGVVRIGKPRPPEPEIPQEDASLLPGLPALVVTLVVVGVICWWLRRRRTMPAPPQP